MRDTTDHGHKAPADHTRLAPPRARRSWLASSVVVVVLHLGVGLIPLNFSQAQSHEPQPTVRLQLAPAPVEPAREKPLPEPVPAPEAPPRPVPPTPQRPTPPRPAPQLPAPVAPALPVPTSAPAPTAPAIPAAPETLPTTTEPTLPEPPAMAAPPAPTTAPKADLQGYGSGLLKAVTREKNYPRMARELGMQGTATVAIRVRKDGTLAAPARLLRSTNHDMLDAEVLRMVHKSAPFPPLPEGVTQGEVQFEIPVRFHIK